jgi:hypothetical protein
MHRLFASVLLPAALLLSSCSTTEYVPRNTLKARTFDLNFQARLFPTSVMMQKEVTSTPVDYFSIIADSAHWLMKEAAVPMAIPLGNLQSITINDQQKGLVMGALIGAGVGTLGGVGFVLLRDHDEMAGSIILAGFGLGGLVGEILGFSIGWPTTYIIQ